jgi:uncharacterized protein YjdB
VVVTTRVQSVTLNARNATLAIGQTYQAVATINPGTASNQDVTWSSSSSSVATVNADGLITAVRNGTSTIRVTTVDGGKFATLTVSVVTPVTGVTVSPTTLTLNRGATSRLVTTITPPFASNVGVKWSSSNTRVATVTTAGVVRGVAVGTATITVRTNSGSLTATCVVTVV